MDLTLPIIGLLGATGYYFTKDGKLPRESKKIRQVIAKNEEPTGTNIYTSVHSRETDSHFREVLNDRYEKSRDFPEQNIFSQLSDLSMNIDTYNDTKKENYKNVAKREVENSELFKPMNYLNALKNPLNTLTGQEIPLEHTNMQPYFKGMMPKGNFSEHGSERRLELLTGVSNLTQQKTEVPSLFEPQRTKFENVMMINREAVQNSVSNKKPFVDPYRKIDVVPIPAESIRPEYRRIEEMRKYDRLVAEGVYNTPTSRTKVTASLGEDVKKPVKNVTTGRYGAPRANSSVRHSNGDYTRVCLDDPSDPYDDLFLSTPAGKHGTRVYTNTTEYTQQPNNVDLRELEGRMPNLSTKQRVSKRENFENMRLTERGDTINDTYATVPNKKRQGVLHSNIEAKTTLKEGNLYQHTANPHSKRMVQATSHEGSSKSLRDVTGNNNDYYTTFNIGAKVPTNTVNDRIKENVDYNRLNLPDGRQRFSNTNNDRVRESVNNRDNGNVLLDSVRDIRKQTENNPFFIKRY